jgi:selenide, water dikinase
VAQVLSHLPKLNDPRVLVGTETHDDAGVYQLTEDLAIVQTVDFFPPVVDDPYVYGQIAAANALSDIYAMGAEPKTVLNLVGYPDDELGDSDWLARILQGGAERCQAAGAVILGGHSVRDKEIKFGLSVTGIVHPKKLLTNSGAKAGDKLVLTKALGTGFIATAAKREACPAETLRAACDSMVQLNAIGRDAALAVGGVHAITDITGFGLCGHSYEMASGSGVTLVIDVNSLPLLPGADQLTKFRTRASKTNREYVEPFMRIEGTLDPIRTEFLWDAQTSGGLLISIEASRVDALVEEARKRGASRACVIGEVRAKGDVSLIFRA